MHVFAHAGSWLQAGPEGCWRYRGNRIFVLFDRPVKLYLGSRLSHMSAWNASWSGSIMCTGGWAKEDPRKWSVSCCDTRCLFSNIFYPINRSSSMLFTIHFFCYASLVYPFLRSSLWTVRERQKTVPMMCHTSCCLQRSDLGAPALHFRVCSMWSLQVCHEASMCWVASLESRAEKLLHQEIVWSYC